VLADFWDAWSNVSVHPDDAGVRSTLLEKGKDVALIVNRMATQLDSAKSTEVSSMYGDVAQLNGLIDKLMKVNKALSSSRAELTEPSDLLDARDNILSEMSKLIDVGVTYNADRTVSVLAGGRWVVDHTMSSPVTAKKSDDGTYGLVTDTGDDLNVKGGSLGGHLTAINETYPNFRNEFSAVVAEFRDKVNAIHKAGYTDPGTDDVSTLVPGGLAFFKEPAAGADSALSLQVALTSQSQIAANGVEGDPPTAVKYGAAALSISQLSSNATITSGYAALVSGVGSAVESAQRDKDLTDVTLEQQRNMRDEVSGVNTEEEMLDILRYEAGYNAAAKIATIVDEMMKTIMSIAS
jgi:flagellar hook-associated protein 1